MLRYSQKTILYASLTLLFMAGCTKDEPAPHESASPFVDAIYPDDTSTFVSAVPATFTSKVLIETALSAKIGAFDLEGIQQLQQLINASPNVMIGACIHSEDSMEVPLFHSLDSVFYCSGFPQAMFNRLYVNGKSFVDRSLWTYLANSCSAQIKKCGLAIESSLPAADSCVVTVHCGFAETLLGKYNLTVYLAEDDVSGVGAGFDQVNFYSGTTKYGSNQFNALPNPIVGFKHQHVVRKVLTSDLGKEIPPANIVQGGEYVLTFKSKLSSAYVPAKMRVVAFISKEGSSAATWSVMNAQSVKLGKMKNWD